MKTNDTLNVFYDNRHVGTLAMTNSHKVAFQAFRLAHFPFLRKRRFSYHRKVVLMDCSAFLQIACRIIGAGCC